MHARMVSVALLVVGALLGSSAGGAAAATEQYTDSEYDWSIEWDDSDWAEPGTLDELPSADLALERDGGASFVLFRALDDYDGDPEECLDDVPDFLASDFPSSSGEIDYEPIEDDDGEPIAEEEDGRAYMAVTFDFDGTDTAVGFDCRTLVENEAVLLIIHITQLRDFEDERAEVDDLLEALELPEASSTGGASGDIETYVSPQYGYALDFDTNDWEISSEDDDPDDAYDRIQLEHELGFVSLFGDPDYSPTQVDDCVEDYTLGLEQGDGVDNVQAMSDEDGEEEDRAWAAFTYDLDSGGDDPFELARYIECRHLGDVTVVILQTSLEVDYDDMSDVRVELLKGLQTLDTEEESPNDDDRPAPDEDENEDEDSADEQAE